MFPSKGWAAYETMLKAVGECREVADRDDLIFVRSLGLVESLAPKLTPVGQAFFSARFIEEDNDRAREIIRSQLLECCPESAAIAQTLAKRPSVARKVAESVLRNQGYGEGLTDRRLGSLLALMSWSEMLDYAKREGRIRVLVAPLTETDLPKSIFINPDTPWTNRKRLEQVLGYADGYLYWLDKHFLPAGLDCLGDVIDGSRVSEVRVLSLELEENNSKRARREYRDLSRELTARGVDLEWRFIDSRDVRDTHDRWIISRSTAWNVPNLNAILSGQHSEISETTNREELLPMFNRAWERAPARAASPVRAAA